MAELVTARDWLTVYQLPPYAHELNPVEPVWSHLKRSLAKPGQTQPRPADRPGEDPAERMQYRPGLLEGFLVGTGLDLTPFRNPHH
jgi:DDE superfamily endonuclease